MERRLSQIDILVWTRTVRISMNIQTIESISFELNSPVNWHLIKRRNSLINDTFPNDLKLYSSAN